MALIQVDLGRLAERPAWPFRVNWASPQALGLFDWYPGEHTGRTQIQGAPVTYNSTYQTISGRPSMPFAGDIGADDGGYTMTARDTAYSSLVNTEPFTLTAWFWYEALAATGVPRGLMELGAGASGWSLAAAIADPGDPATLTASVVTSSGGLARYTATGTRQITRRQWQHAAVVWNPGAGLSVYVNGVFDAANTTTTTTIRDVDVWRMASQDVGDLVGGFQGGSISFTGMVCDNRLYRRALTSADVWALYDPRTRWDLYWVPGRRVFFDIAAAPSVNRRRRVLLSA